jgi:hypothetical protein
VSLVSAILEIEVEDDTGDLESLRWRLVDAPAPIRKIHMDGFEWRVQALGDDAGLGPRTAIVEDSSDGSARLVFGGTRGLLLTAADQERHERYLLVACSVLIE